MSTTVIPELKRLVRRHPVIGHPFARMLMKADRAKRPWQMAAHGMHWAWKARQEYQGLLGPRLNLRAFDGIEAVGPIPPEDVAYAIQTEEIEIFAGWFLDVMDRADVPFALGALYGYEDTFDVMFGANELPPGWAVRPLSPVWEQVMPATNLEEARKGVGAAQTMISRFYEALFDDMHQLACEGCGLPMRLVSEQFDKFWCKRCQKEVSV